MSSKLQKRQLIELCKEAASSIHTECTKILIAKNDHEQGITTTALGGCGLALVDLLLRQANIVHGLYENVTHSKTASDEHKSNEAQSYDLAFKRLEDLASIAYAKFYAYIYKDLPACWRQLYTDARILKFCLLFLKSAYARGSDEVAIDDAASTQDSGLDELVKTLDLALILAGAAGERRGRKWIDQALHLLHLIWLEESEHDHEATSGDITSGHDRPSKRAKLAGNHVASESHGTHIESSMFSDDEPFTPPVTHPVRAVESQSIEEFQTYMDRPHDPKIGPEPLIIRNSLSGWPALSTRPWNQPSYLLSQTFDGRRLVPVEVGRSYVDEGWGQKLITFAEFLRDYIDPTIVSSAPSLQDGASSNETEKDESSEATARTQSNPTIGYLAQHQLFTQLPTLRNDILVPDYCYTSPPPHPTNPTIDQPELEEPLLNAWFGPPGTISPLHNDPYHNILTQVVGRKYVRLYAPQETAGLAARGKENGVEMGNTSALDVGVLEGWDSVSAGSGDEDRDRNGDEEGAEISVEDIERFKALPFVDCILEPGDALYIPIGWWHYVRGLSVSFSVSFWWN
ncbi:hypothetical protein F4808DRAFT_217427 [Astrocystis sublimbata]|nr:hypothetical protein F4808DRAFT_217427 [Astrocystis sublimbata]